MEDIVRDISTPLFQAANIDHEDIKIIFINSREINAYVTTNNLMVINIGLILFSNTPDILAGVLAHEIGHIAAGHISRKEEDAKNGTFYSALGTISSVLLLAAGGNENLATTLAVGGVGLSYRMQLKYSREYETVADHLAIEYLRKAKYGTKGLRKLLQKFSSDETINKVDNLPPYLLTHPLSTQRLNSLPSDDNDDHSGISEDMKKRFTMMYAKIRAFTDDTKTTLENYQDDKSDVGHYARSIAFFRNSDTKNAIKELSQINIETGYIDELKGEIFYKNGNINDAIAEFEKAKTKLKDNDNINLQLAICLASSDVADSNKKAVSILKNILYKNPNNPLALHYIAIGYGKTGELFLSYSALLKKAELQKDKAKIQLYSQLVEKYKPTQ